MLKVKIMKSRLSLELFIRKAKSLKSLVEIKMLEKESLSVLLKKLRMECLLIWVLVYRHFVHIIYLRV